MSHAHTQQNRRVTQKDYFITQASSSNNAVVCPHIIEKHGEKNRE